MRVEGLGMRVGFRHAGMDAPRERQLCRHSKRPTHSHVRPHHLMAGLGFRCKVEKVC